MILRAYKDLSIKRKLTAIIMATSAVSLLLAGSAFLAYEVLEARRELQREFSITADVLAANSATALIFEDSKAAADILHALNTDDRILAAAIYDRSGRPFASLGRIDGRPEKAAQAGAAVVEFNARE